jgi:hypothetical protein
MPETERTFLLPFDSAAAAVAARDRVLGGVLQPMALDLWNPAASASIGNRAWMLAVRAGGNQAAVERYERELAQLGEGVALDNDRQETLWNRIREFTPYFLAEHPDGAVVRVSCTLKELGAVMESFPGPEGASEGTPVLARAGSGVCYGYFTSAAAVSAWMNGPSGRGWKAVIEFAPESREQLDLWPSPGADLEVMRRIKLLFDPSNLMNRGRLYNRL